MEDSCEYIEKTFLNNRQVVVLELVGWVWANSLLLESASHCHTKGRI
jgi:hypothetical protein